MTYRNDHDAALARVDALESELEQMAGEYEKTRAALAARQRSAPAPRTWSSAFIAVSLAVAALATGGVMFMHALGTPDEPEPPVAAAPAVSVPTADLEMCLARVEASMRDTVVLDAKTTDPRGSLARSPQAIVDVGAGCRPALDDMLAGGGLDAPTRALLGRWIAHEDELAGAIGRIIVYYGSDPYRLDGYASAPQLWREFERARDSRDALIVAERIALRSAVVH